uniref:Uncharacterized protein n=1 Tax=Pristionchus pacificus TaxID=54126 RepID=A0A2A6B6Y3_PRIPA|eukprot:PDM61628.1 hypothetical protein PRIPAC_51070 [Pristionchus pacificus]
MPNLDGRKRTKANEMAGKLDAATRVRNTGRQLFILHLTGQRDEIRKLKTYESLMAVWGINVWLDELAMPHDDG